MIGFKGIYYIHEGLFAGEEVRFDVELIHEYPKGLSPTIHIHNRIPHPLLGADQILNITPLLPTTVKHVTMGNLLKAFKAAFQEKVIRALKPEQCVNLAIKYQYR